MLDQWIEHAQLRLLSPDLITMKISVVSSPNTLSTAKKLNSQSLMTRTKYSGWDLLESTLSTFSLLNTNLTAVKLYLSFNLSDQAVLVLLPRLVNNLSNHSLPSLAVFMMAILLHTLLLTWIKS